MRLHRQARLGPRWALWTLLATACTPYPDEWGRRCGEDADSGAPYRCDEPFVCAYRDDYRWPTEEISYHECSIPCETEFDCPAWLGGDRPVACKLSGYCANR